MDEPKVPTEQDRRRRTRTVSTKLTEAEYHALVTRAGPTRISEWVRRTIIDHLNRVPSTRPWNEAVQVLLAEVMALRVINVNALDKIASGAQVSHQTIRDIVEHADKEKHEKAQRALTSERTP